MPAQLLAAPAIFHASLGQVSYPNSPGCRRSFRVPAADDQQVLVDDSWTGQVHRLRPGGLTAEVLAQVNSALVSEAKDGSAGDRIQGVDEVHHTDEDPLILAPRPIRESAIRLGPARARIKLPEQSSRSRVQ